MKAAQFDYVRASTVAEAVAVLDQHEDAKILAGGQSLVPLLALRMARPSVVVDINPVADLSSMSTMPDGSLRAGALVRHQMLVEQPHHGLLAEVARWIGHAAIRSRGTFGGSIAHADPAAELPALVVALDAGVHVTGPGGDRRIESDGLFAGALSTTVRENEMITAIDFPPVDRWGFAEFSHRHGDFAVVLALAAEVGGEIRIVLGGVGPTPVRALGAEQELRSGGPDSVGRAAAAAAAEIDPTGDLHGTVEFRRTITAEMVRRACAQLDSSASARASVEASR